ncbi:MAG: hypothetical protein LBV52_06385 [Spirochaetaceae bacterium]|jgi:hypothetical protein|nr:hypothetical protein [Spirochaetaceae bacterium]
MKCCSVKNYLYDFSYPENIIEKLHIMFHLLHCKECARDKRAVLKAKSIMQSSFLPAEESDELSDAVMEMIWRKTKHSDLGDDLLEQGFPDPLKEAFSFNVWVVAGVIIFVSLLLGCLGINFLDSHDKGYSFLLPMGITIGGVITAYGALFIGSHIQELKKKIELLGFSKLF